MLLWTLLLPLGLLYAALASASQCGMEERAQRVRRTARKSRSLHIALEDSSCSTSLARGRRSLTSLEHLRLHHHRHHHQQQQREGHQGAAESVPSGRALYFTGHRDQLRLKAGNELPGDSFTLQVWLRAEGGQRSPAVIAGLYDKCTYSSHDRGWVLGIEAMSDQGTRDPRYIFSLKTDRARKMTTITAHRNYLPNQWIHLSVTYNGRILKLYINGAQVATSSEQVGPVFSPFTRKCKTLMIGGNALNQNYRGYMEQFGLWKIARTQKEILQDMGQAFHGLSNSLPQLVLQDSFENMNTNWFLVDGKYGKMPQTEDIHLPVSSLDTNLNLPQCGQTLCDNLEVISSYNNVAGFQRPRVVRYTVVNVFDDNHENPTVTKEQIELQHRKLNEAFNPYNITWELHVLEMNDSFLRYRLILTNCDITKIGNSKCDLECNHKLTGYDGGDCRRRTSCLYSSRKENSVCDMDCNTEELNFDGGTCCNPNVTDVTKTCFDPISPYRAYLDLNELKHRLNVTGSSQLNIFFVNSSEDELAGVATWPWDKEVLTHLGGIVMNPSFFGVPGHTHTMIHEIGHSLGLYHVFRGISEILSCSDPCMETDPSYETGDLCHDTNPSPKHKTCGDPVPGPGNDTCGFQTFLNTPYNNYMSYAEDDCTDSFTPNQVARMHCYLDLVYQGWQPSFRPSPVAIAPQIVQHTFTSVTLEWFPPIDGYIFERDLGSACHLCVEKRILVQYGSNASSPVPCKPSGNWSPREAEGLPDVDLPCETNVRTWSPGADYNTVPPSCTEPHECFLQLQFTYPVIPQTLTIWVTFVTTDSETKGAEVEVKVLHVNGENTSLGAQSIFCDVPLTIKLDYIKVEVYAIQIYTKDNQMEIDAAMITSVPNYPLCADCKPIYYKVLRDPPFPPGTSTLTSSLQRRYIDRDLKHGRVYKYQIVTITASGESEPSAELVYHHGNGYCGDGIIQKILGEECDDMNKINGDGCSLFCREEASFRCLDEPSRCYFHDGDGVCEDFEKMTSIKDCGVYTPNGFQDQWASNVTVSHHNDHDCPGRVVIGEPAATQVCQTKVEEMNPTVSQYAWYPCTVKQTMNFWLKAHFSQYVVVAAVVVHLVTDGTSYSYQKPETISVHLIDVKEQMHDLGVHILSCRNNPLVIPVLHDLSQPFYHSKAVLISFSSNVVAISGVALRSFHDFDPIKISSCQRGEIYSATEQSCVHYSCEDPDCQELKVENAALNCTNGRYHGAQCEVTCHTGYRLKIHRTHRNDAILKPQIDSQIIITCRDGKWSKQVTCEPVDCGPPVTLLNHIYHASFYCPNGTTYRKQCTFQCYPPAHMKGMKNTLTCLEDGLWSFPEAICELMCMAPQPLANAELQTARCLSNGHKVGSSCKYKCRVGYHVPDPTKKIRKKAFKIQCTKDGKWQSGECVPVMCEPPHTKFMGFYQCTNGFQYNSECRLPCNDSNKQSDFGHNIIRCQIDGTWSGSFELCDSMKGSCEPPHLSAFNPLVISCTQGYEIGAECNVTCFEYKKKEVVILPPNVTEKSLQHWMNPKRVQKITCTGRKQWYPLPEELHCIKRCEPIFIADKYCDGVNNWAFCGYDGGDCCLSTVKSKEINPFPPTDCDLQGKCACLDPNAEENHPNTQSPNHG